MPRQKKCRKVGFIPINQSFLPEKNEKDVEEVIVSFVEIEAIRLADLEGLDQTTAASKMEISRGTYQRIINEGRKKIADALINGKKIIMAGGDYQMKTEDHVICCCKKVKKCSKFSGIKPGLPLKDS